MFACIADDEYNYGILVCLFCDFQRRREIRARRTTAKNALTPGKVPSQLERLPIGDIYDLIDDLHIGISDRQALPDALDEVRRGFRDVPRLFVCLEDRAIRIGANDADLWVFLF